MKTLILSLVAEFTLVTMAIAEEKDPWIGKRVFTQYGAVLKVGKNVVDDEGRATDLAASGKARSDSRVYRVEHVNGKWLWLRDEDSGASGWVDTRYVIPYEQAIDFYTNQIKINPSAYLYAARGNIWSHKGEDDIAIADYNEAIRLEPSNATYFSNRGSSWSAKKNYEKAVADCNEAIRLEPKYADAYIQRGCAWGNKKDYDKAIDDFNEALRLKPKDADTYHKRGYVWGLKKDYEKAIDDFNEALRLDPKDARVYNGRAWFWATCSDGKFRDGKRALESATKACELTGWNKAYYLGM